MVRHVRREDDLRNRRSELVVLCRGDPVERPDVAVGHDTERAESMVLLLERVPEDEVLVPAVRRVARLGEELFRHSHFVHVVAEGCRQEGEALPGVETRHDPTCGGEGVGRLQHVDHVEEVVVGVVGHGGADCKDQAAHAVLTDPLRKPGADEHRHSQMAEDIAGQSRWVEVEAEQLPLGHCGGDGGVVNCRPFREDCGSGTLSSGWGMGHVC
mmetsp:Transcript_63852/g.152754  ORF Transcript_63852/g.152754 Transcript_63852/m.152754 type:complete len:213 (+) Transcript_63852:169-807(+)